MSIKPTDSLAPATIRRLEQVLKSNDDNQIMCTEVALGSASTSIFSRFHSRVKQDKWRIVI
jgi:hypothetical protein